MADTRRKKARLLPAGLKNPDYSVYLGGGDHSQ